MTPLEEAAIAYVCVREEYQKAYDRTHARVQLEDAWKILVDAVEENCRLSFDG